MVTVRVRTADTGQSLAIVAAGKEAGRDVGDPLDAEVTEVLCVACIEVGREMPEMVTEYVLQGVGAPPGIVRPQ